MIPPAPQKTVQTPGERDRMSDYTVTPDETRQIVEAFVAAHPYLTPRTGTYYASTDHPVFDDEESEDDNTAPAPGPHWLVQVTDPTGQTHMLSHEVVLRGLNLCLYVGTALEDGLVGSWMTLHTAQERAETPLPPWGPSRLIQRALFDGRWPFQGHAIGRTAQERRKNYAAFTQAPDSAPQD